MSYSPTPANQRFFGTPLQWRPRHEEAALMVAEGKMRPAEIIQTLGVDYNTYNRWTRHPDFVRRVQEIRTDLNERIMELAIANKWHRLSVLNDLEAGLLQVIKERGDALRGDAAGTGTGLVVRQEKVFGTGQNQTSILEYLVDAGTVAEIRALQKQAAQESGQWSDKQSIDHSGNVGIKREYVLIPYDDSTPVDIPDLPELEEIVDGEFDGG